jgi:hypothetical protein
MAGKELPADVEIDGRDISGVLMRGEPSPHEEILLFDNERVVGLRTQRWKYVTHTYYRGININLERQGYAELFDLARDVSESYSVSETYPEVAAEMRRRIEGARERFAPYKRGIPSFIQELMKQGRRQQQD